LSIDFIHCICYNDFVIVDAESVCTIVKTHFIFKGVFIMEKLLEILKSIRSDIDFENETKLIDDGILDSFDIVSIVAELCEEYDVTITVDMLEPENFNSAAAMLALVEQLLDEE